MPRIMIPLDIPDGEYCNNCQFLMSNEKIYYPNDMRKPECLLFGETFYVKFGAMVSKCPACLEACERAEPKSVTDCNGLVEK